MASDNKKATANPVDEEANRKRDAEELANNKKLGKWEDTFSIENVACHATLLHTGDILCWGRRSNPMSTISGLDEQKTTAWLLEIKGKFDVQKDQIGKLFPTCKFPNNVLQLPGTASDKKESNVNIFCSGHCLQSDGSLFVAGGHIVDGNGAQQACVYKPENAQWTPFKLHEKHQVGRWYPSTICLPDSRVLVISGSHAPQDYTHPDLVPQIWRGDAWEEKMVQSPPSLPLYPRLHLDPYGEVFMAGPLKQSSFLNVNMVSTDEKGEVYIGKWNAAAERNAGAENGTSVTYDTGKILWTGGGDPATPDAQIIDLNLKNPDKGEVPKWENTTPMGFARRHHNLTTLPDGTVLVTGGSSGPGFNNLEPGSPVHIPELWGPRNEDPSKRTWTKLAPEACDRCYHGVALLLPDASILSMGSGEGGSPWNPPNPSRDNFTNAQRFKPPYFFEGDPPKVTGTPRETKYGLEFTVHVQGSDLIERISWIRLPSVTHGLNSSQSVVFQKPPSPQGGQLKVTTPNNRNVATPGWYMLFFVNTQGRPSVADFIRISPEKTDKEPQPPPQRKRAPDATPNNKNRTNKMAQVVHSIPELDKTIIAEQKKPAVKVGLTPVCPYGLGPCWAGAFEGLESIEDIDVVRPLPDQANSVAYLYLKDDILPDIDAWREQFTQTTGGTYSLRGIEMTLSGVVSIKHVSTGDELLLASTSTRPDLVLTPFKADSILERDHKAGVLKPVSDRELGAYMSLLHTVAGSTEKVSMKVTGRLHKLGANEFSLDVREFEVLHDHAAAS